VNVDEDFAMTPDADFFVEIEGDMFIFTDDPFVAAMACWFAELADVFVSAALPINMPNIED
jgi:hypothetical protein